MFSSASEHQSLLPRTLSQQVKGNLTPILNMGNELFFFFQLKEATESSGSTNEDRESYGSPGERHNGMGFENRPPPSYSCGDC